MTDRPIPTTGRSRRRFDAPETTPEDHWRAIVLFGRNVASYKFALGKSLIELAVEAKTEVNLEELAIPFSRHVAEHLQGADKQATSATSRYLDACRAFNRGEIPQDQLIDRTVELGFTNVIDAFHIVNGAPTPTTFFTDERRSGGGIRLTDALLQTVIGGQAVNLPMEIESRWRLVETAWELNLPKHLVSVQYEPEAQGLVVEDSRQRRRSVTGARGALSGYQDGACFYCGGAVDASMAVGVDVDHFLPWSLGSLGFPYNLDGVWNLVLACPTCNRGEGGKSARIPTLRYLESLHDRNEYLIGSHHPLRETLMLQTGLTEPLRASFLRGAYADAARLLIHTWEPPPQ